jgi:iron complex outermembrane recepter protein
MSSTRIVALSAASALAIGFAAATPVVAQEGESDEVIVVTGVRTAERTVLDTPVPVDVFAAEDLQQAGAVGNELGQALAIVAPSFNFPRQSNSGTSDHVRAGQLRGLSPDQLLVLVNGKRRYTSAIVNSETKIGRGQAAVDFNAIPLSAVKRVEVLRDGAGAQYGSDAIAGVVNVILDDDPSTLRGSASYGLHITDLEPTDQEIRDGETFTFDASAGFKLGDSGFVRFGGEYLDRQGTNRAGFDQIPFFEDQTPANLALAGRRNYALGDPDTKGLLLWANSEIQVRSFELYGFATFGRRESEGGAAFFRYPDGFSNVTAIYPNGYRPSTTGDTDDLSLVGGYRTNFFGWAVDSSIAYGRNGFEFGVVNSLNPSLGTASPTSFKSGEYVFDQLTTNTNVQRDFDLGLAGPLTFAAGFEARRETYETTRGDLASYVAGPQPLAIGAQAAPGLTPADEVDIDRQVLAVYLDASADLTDRFFVNGALRYEDYDDFGGELTGKVSALFELTDNLNLRAAVSNSFRAPALAQRGYSDTTLNFGSGGSLVRTRTLRIDDPIAQALGARELNPETSFNVSGGGTFAWDRFRLSIDAFQVQVDDRITLSERFFGPAFVAFVTPLPGGATTQSARFFTNAIDTETRGVDIVGSTGFEGLGGTFTVTGGLTYAETEIQDFAATPAQLLAVDPTFRLIGVEEINTIEEAAPKIKFVGSVDWQGETWGILGRVSRFGETARVFNFGGGFEPRQEYAGKTQLDLEGRFDVTQNVRVSVGANNVTDEYPDLSSADINYFGNLPYDILNPVGVNGRFVYAKVSASF